MFLNIYRSINVSIITNMQLFKLEICEEPACKQAVKSSGKASENVTRKRKCPTLIEGTSP